MSALLDIWNKAAVSEDDVSEDELAELDPDAYQLVMARKAHKNEQETAELEQHDLKIKAEERERQQAAEVEAILIRADQWDHTMTEFGGRRMSQADAQNARQYITDHSDRVVEWGIRHGQFKTEAEGQAYVGRTGRLHELNESDRTGQLSAEGRAERTGLEQQQQPYSAVSSHFAEEQRQFKAENGIPTPQKSSVAIAVTTAVAVNAADDNQFRARVPDLVGAFAMQANVPKEPQPVPEAIEPMPTAAKARVMEFS